VTAIELQPRNLGRARAALADGWSMTRRNLAQRAVADMPNLSVVIRGLDHWDRAHATPITENRLIAERCIRRPILRHYVQWERSSILSIDKTTEQSR
jgi:hypothetical protein